MIPEWLVDLSNNTVRFPHLKSLHIKQTLPSKSLFLSLLLLTKCQINELKLSFDSEITEVHGSFDLQIFKIYKKDALILLKSFLHHLFSNDCILISLELNLAFHLREEFRSLKFYDKYSSCCLTLRHLYLHLVYICVLDDIIQCVSSLETLRISCQDSIKVEPYEFEQAVMLFQSDTNWKYKVRFRKVNL